MSSMSMYDVILQSCVTSSCLPACNVNVSHSSLSILPRNVRGMFRQVTNFKWFQLNIYYLNSPANYQCTAIAALLITRVKSFHLSHWFSPDRNWQLCFCTHNDHTPTFAHWPHLHNAKSEKAVYQSSTNYSTVTTLRQGQSCPPTPTFLSHLTSPPSRWPSPPACFPPQIHLIPCSVGTAGCDIGGPNRRFPRTQNNPLKWWVPRDICQKYVHW